MELVAFADSRVGNREKNEDAVGIVRESGLFVVADGMGGYQGGEIASRLAVDIVGGCFRALAVDASPLDAMVQMDAAFRRANEDVRAEQTGDLASMGATLTALVIRGREAVIGHVGDSRVYRFRGSALQRITRDHTFVESLKDAGVYSAGIHRCFSHVLTRAVGTAEDCTPDLHMEELEAGDRFLLCTDGVTDVVDDETIAAVLASEPASESCRTLVAEALRRGSPDNVTALVVEVRAVGDAAEVGPGGDEPRPTPWHGAGPELRGAVDDPPLWARSGD
jgi:serine/threonine protein phosphatase PrpC